MTFKNQGAVTVCQQVILGTFKTSKLTIKSKYELKRKQRNRTYYFVLKKLYDKAKYQYRQNNITKIATGCKVRK